MTFRTHHQIITDMRLYSIRVMLLQSILFLVMGSLTTITILSVQSGDLSNIRERREAVRTLTMPPSTQIK